MEWSTLIEGGVVVIQVVLAALLAWGGILARPRGTTTLPPPVRKDAPATGSGRPVKTT